MNEDSYAEWLVKRKDPIYAVPVKAVMVILCLITLLIALGTIIGSLLFLIVLVLTYIVFINLSIEYEYQWLDGDLIIDRVLGKARRKKYLNCKKEEIQIVAPSDSYILKDYEKGGMKVKDCSSGKAGVPTYSLIYQRGSDCVKIIFEPSERMLRAIRQSIPSKLAR